MLYLYPSSDRFIEFEVSRNIVNLLWELHNPFPRHFPFVIESFFNNEIQYINTVYLCSTRHIHSTSEYNDDDDDE